MCAQHILGARGETRHIDIWLGNAAFKKWNKFLNQIIEYWAIESEHEVLFFSLIYLVD